MQNNALFLSPFNIFNCMKAFAEIARRADDAEGLARRAWTRFVAAKCFDQFLRLQAAFAEHFIDEPTGDAAIRQGVDFRFDRFPFVMGERQFRMVACLAFEHDRANLDAFRTGEKGGGHHVGDFMTIGFIDRDTDIGRPFQFGGSGDEGKRFRIRPPGAGLDGVSS